MTSDYPLLSSTMNNSFDFSVNSTMLAELNDWCGDDTMYTQMMTKMPNATFCKKNPTADNKANIVVNDPAMNMNINDVDDDTLLYSIADLDDLFSSTSSSENNNKTNMNEETQFDMNDENDAMNIDSFALSLFSTDDNNNETITSTSSEIDKINDEKMFDVLYFDDEETTTTAVHNNVKDIPTTDATIQINNDYNRLIQLMGLSPGALNCLNGYNQNIESYIKSSSNQAKYLPKHKFNFSERLIVEQPSPELIDSRLPYIYIPKMDLINDNYYTHPLSKKFSTNTNIYHHEELDTIELQKNNVKAYRQRSIQSWLAKRKRRKYRNTSSVVYRGLSLAACKKQRSKGKFIKETHWISIA